MSEIEALYQQIRELRTETMHPLARIRVTPHAFRGTAAVMPLSPERARTYAPLTHEILIHPGDWNDLRRSPRILELVGVAGTGITQLFGLPIVEQP